MPDYKKLYHIMFNTATDAVEMIELHDYAAARNMLIEAQKKAEEIYISSVDARSEE